MRKEQVDIKFKAVSDLGSVSQDAMAFGRTMSSIQNKIHSRAMTNLNTLERKMNSMYSKMNRKQMQLQKSQDRMDGIKSSSSGSVQYVKMRDSDITRDERLRESVRRRRDRKLGMATNSKVGGARRSRPGQGVFRGSNLDNIYREESRRITKKFPASLLDSDEGFNILDNAMVRGVWGRKDVEKEKMMRIGAFGRRSGLGNSLDFNKMSSLFTNFNVLGIAVKGVTLAVKTTVKAVTMLGQGLTAGATAVSGFVTALYSGATAIGEMASQFGIQRQMVSGTLSTLDTRGRAEFGSTANLISDISGFGRTQSGAMTAQIMGQLQSMGLQGKVASGRGGVLETAMRLADFRGTSDEEAVDRILRVMGGSVSPSELGLAGAKFSSKDTPEQRLNEVLRILRMNPATSGWANPGVKGTVGRITSAPSLVMEGMFNRFGEGGVAKLFEPVADFFERMAINDRIQQMFINMSGAIARISPSATDAWVDVLAFTGESMVRLGAWAVNQGEKFKDIFMGSMGIIAENLPQIQNIFSNLGGILKGFMPSIKLGVNLLIDAIDKILEVANIWDYEPPTAEEISEAEKTTNTLNEQNKSNTTFVTVHGNVYEYNNSDNNNAFNSIGGSGLQ